MRSISFKSKDLIFSFMPVSLNRGLSHLPRNLKWFVLNKLTLYSLFIKFTIHCDWLTINSLMLDYMHSIQHLLLIIAHDLNQDLDSIITRKGRFSAVNEMDIIIALVCNRALCDQRQTKGSWFLRRLLLDGHNCQRQYISFSSSKNNIQICLRKIFSGGVESVPF